MNQLDYKQIKQACQVLQEDSADEVQSCRNYLRLENLHEILITGVIHFNITDCAWNNSYKLPSTGTLAQSKIYS